MAPCNLGYYHVAWSPEQDAPMDTLPDADRPLMTAEAFLATDQRVFGEGRFELIDGRVVAMAPTSDRHGDVQSNIDAAMRAAIAAAGLPCRVRQVPGVRPLNARQRVRLPDVGVVCRDRKGRYVVLFEIVSPSNEGTVYRDRLADLKTVEGVQEIVELEQHDVFARIHRRDGDAWTTSDVCGKDSELQLQSLGISVRMATFYVDLDGYNENL